MSNGDTHCVQAACSLHTLGVPSEMEIGRCSSMHHRAKYASRRMELPHSGGTCFRLFRETRESEQRHGLRLAGEERGVYSERQDRNGSCPVKRT